MNIVGINLNQVLIENIESQILVFNDLQTKCSEISNTFLMLSGISNQDLSAAKAAVSNFSKVKMKIFSNITAVAIAATSDNSARHNKIMTVITKAKTLFDNTNIVDHTHSGIVGSACNATIKARFTAHNTNTQSVVLSASDAAKARSAIELTLKDSINCVALDLVTAGTCASLAKNIAYKTDQLLKTADQDSQALDSADRVARKVHHATLAAARACMSQNYSAKSFSLLKENHVVYVNAINDFKKCINNFTAKVMSYKDQIILNSIHTRTALVVHSNKIMEALISSAIGTISASFITATGDASTAAATTAAVAIAVTTSTTDLSLTSDFIASVTDAPTAGAVAGDASTAAGAARAALDAATFEVQSAMTKLYATSNKFREIISSLKEHESAVRNHISSLTPIVSTSAVHAAHSGTSKGKQTCTGAGAGAGAMN